MVRWLCSVLLAQSQSNPLDQAGSSNPASELTDGQTIEIDPSASSAIEITQPNASEEGLGESDSPIADRLEDAMPQTGSEAVDESLGTLARTLGGLFESFVEMIPNLVIALIVLIITAIIASIASKAVRKVTKKLKLPQNLQDLLGKFAYIGAWFIGLVAAAGIVFPGFGMGELVATAGLASIAIGFAFQDIFENFLAGILILWRFPFNDGDFIEVPSVDVMGKVEETQIRMTCIRSVTGELILVPNSTIFKNVVNVLTDRDVRRMTVICGIAYAEDVAEGRRVMKQAVESCESVSKRHDVEIFAQEFGDSAINFEVTWWTGPTPLEQRRSRDEVVEAVKSALDNAGIEIPYPYRTLTFTKNEPDIINAVSGRVTRNGNGKQE